MQNWIKNAARVVTTAQQVGQELSKLNQAATRRLSRSRSRSNSREPAVKLENIDLRPLVKIDSSECFSVYSSSNKKQFFVVFVPDRLCVLKTENNQLAANDRELLNKFPNVAVYSQEQQTLAEYVRQMRGHSDWLEIHIVCGLGFTDLVEKMCEKDSLAMVNTPTSEAGILPLHIAAQRKNWPLAKQLIDLGADIRKCDLSARNTLHYAVLHDDSEFVKAFDSHRHEQFQSAVKQLDINEYSPLVYALKSENGNCIKCLVKNGANTDISDLNIVEYGVTPRALAVLLSCDKNALMKESQSTFLHYPFPCPLLKVASKYCPEVVDHRDKNGRSPLHVACVRKDLEAAMNLLAYGASVDVVGKAGNTPLHLAVQQGDEYLTKLLLCMDLESTINVENKSGQTPFQMNNSSTMTKILNEYQQNEEKASAEACSELTPLLKMSHDFAVKTQLKVVSEGSESSLRLLSLDGGGIRGIVLTIMLAHIEKYLDGQRLIDCFDWIAGTSTGAILAVALVDGYSVMECLRWYLRLKDEVFQGTRPHDPVHLENFLKQEFGERLMEELNPKKRVFVTTCRADQHPPKLVLLRNYELAPTLTEAHGKMKAWKACRCSSAAPTYFPSADNVYLDGGLICNNPTLDLLTEVEFFNTTRKIENNEPLPVSVVLSCGTGVIPSQLMQNLDLELPKNYNFTSIVANIASSAMTLNGLKNIFVEQLAVSDGPVVERSRAFASAMQTPFYRYTPKLEIECPLNTRDNKEIIRLMWTAKLFAISRSNEEMQQLASLLVRKTKTES
ncbi:85/88 kDa calcium-independent phospholipase A2 [Aphelenchoides besseyi]|nr:85/88 kDa calcium-independent phospholipase A2 [Aphelenchoides besseyi]